MQEKRKKLRDQISEVMRARSYSLRTEETYIEWCKRYYLFHNKRSPQEMGVPEITQFLNHLAVDLKASRATQHQAWQAISFMYKHVLNIPLSGLSVPVIAKAPQTLPVILTREEAKRMLAVLDGVQEIIVSLLYASGLRLMECVCLRVKDIDFKKNRIIVWNEQRDQSRLTMLPLTLKPMLEKHLEKIKILHEKDLKNGFGSVYLPHSITQEYPEAHKEWEWHYLFPAKKITHNTTTGRDERLHLSGRFLQKIVKKAAIQAGLDKNVSCHTLRHSFAVHLLESGCPVKTVQDLLGHKEITSTLIYSRFIKDSGITIKSPLDTIS